MNRRNFVQAAMITGAHTLTYRAKAASALSLEATGEAIVIRPNVAGGSLPHVWEECIGSDRAAVGMRHQWLLDLERVRKEAGIKAVRFHGLFNDEMGVWPAGSKAPNFLYVDAVFDAMLERGVKPLVELSFMPAYLASGSKTALFYRGNITPPKDMAQWGELITALATHCIERYGIEETSTWKFEVWNEPNLIFFWSGTQTEYFELYKQAAISLKTVSSRLKVGGPSAARAGWVKDFLAYCSAQQAPVDFVTTHIYPDDPQAIVFGEGIHYSFEEVIPRAIAKVKEDIKNSPTPGLPLYVTEWSSQNPAFIAHIVKSTNGLADMMSYWTFDSVYEELGIPKAFMNNSFGLLGQSGVPRPSFHTFTLLHRLGDSLVECGDGPVLATRRKDGSLAILVWNLIPQPPGVRSSTGDPTIQSEARVVDGGESKEIVLRFEGHHKHFKGRVTRVDENSGNLRKAYKELGSPLYPTVQQIAEVKRKSELAPPQSVSISAKGEISINLTRNGVALLELF